MDEASFDGLGVELLEVLYGFALFEAWEEG